MNIYIGNLSDNTTTEDLIEKFSAFGLVKNAKVIVDRDTQRPRGFGFLEMPADNDARRAIETLNQTDLKGSVIKVSPARKKTGGQMPQRNFNSRYENRNPNRQVNQQTEYYNSDNHRQGR